MSLAIETGHGGILPGEPEVPGPHSHLRPVSDVDPIGRSRALFNESIRLREEALGATRPEGAEMENVRASVGEWIEREGILKEIPDYRNYSRTVIDSKVGRLVSFLRVNYSGTIPEIDLLATETFVDASFAMYEATPKEGTSDSKETEEGNVASDADGSFAFLVPVRTSRTRDDYSEEAEVLCPALRYVPSELTGLMAVGLPPTVIAEYAMDKNGKRGHVIMAAVYGDMQRDLSQTEALRVAQKNVNDAAVFAQRRLGSTMLGLGATLPGFTHHGASVKSVLEKGALTTSGHGGTAYLMLETLRAALEQDIVLDKSGNAVKADTLKSIGFLGLGAIGAPAAAIIADAFPNAQMNVYDTRGLQRKYKEIQSTITKLAEKRGADGSLAANRVIIAESEADLINNSQVIMSAATGQFDLKNLGVESLEGKFIGDDSQPSSFSKEQVVALGGVVAGITGYDDGHNYGQSTAVRELYHFGMLAERQVFGCEAEVAALYRYYGELLDRGMGEEVAQRIVNKVAVTKSVTVEGARYVGALFKKDHIVSAKIER